ncbi:hypothetical protein H2248_005481 [Termitomyces sp. 'cryptogamus']|nr:hypothetical protein H2248_005481 [Termitomyces sp. 'cryptogamus']
MMSLLNYSINYHARCAHQLSSSPTSLGNASLHSALTIDPYRSFSAGQGYHICCLNDQCDGLSTEHYAIPHGNKLVLPRLGLKTLPPSPYLLHILCSAKRRSPSVPVSIFGTGSGSGFGSSGRTDVARGHGQVES